MLCAGSCEYACQMKKKREEAEKRTGNVFFQEITRMDLQEAEGRKDSRLKSAKGQFLK